MQVQLEYYTKETERLSVENELLKQQLQTAEEHRDRLINELQQDDEAHQHTEEELTAQLIDKDNQVTEVQNMLKSCQEQINQLEEHIATIQPLLESNSGNMT